MGIRISASKTCRPRGRTSRAPLQADFVALSGTASNLSGPPPGPLAPGYDASTGRIEPHEAPVEDFPRQPSQKDGLGRICKVPWNLYTAGLARDAKVRKADEASDLAEPGDPAKTTADDPGVSPAPPERKRRRPETTESPAAEAEASTA